MAVKYVFFFLTNIWTDKGIKILFITIKHTQNYRHKSVISDRKIWREWSSSSLSAMKLSDYRSLWNVFSNYVWRALHSVRPCNFLCSCSTSASEFKIICIVYFFSFQLVYLLLLFAASTSFSLTCDVHKWLHSLKLVTSLFLFLKTSSFTILYRTVHFIFL